MVRYPLWTVIVAVRTPDAVIPASSVTYQ